MARQVEAHFQHEYNLQLELLASAILSYTGLEESVPVRAAVSRGSVEQVVTNTAYEARRCFANLTRSMKTEVVTMGRKKKNVDSTCNGNGDELEGAVPEGDDDEETWWSQIESDADVGRGS